MTPEGLSRRKLIEDLQSHNDYFDELVNRFPASIYIQNDAEENFEEHNKKYRKGQHKENKEAKRAALKLKKYDPDADINASTVKQMQLKEGKKQTTTMPVRKMVSVPVTPTADEVGKSRIEILRERLRAKIAEKAALNGSAVNNNGSSNAGTISKRAARRAEKQRRIEEAKKRNAANGGNSTVAKQSNKKMEIATDENNDINSNGSSRPQHSTENSENIANIDYGTLVGLDASVDAIDRDYMKLSKKKRKNKSLERMMEEAEQKKQKLIALKEKARQGDEEAAEKASKIDWSDTLKSAAGNKVHLKNDPALIKKAIKRKQKKKEKSAAKWKTRNDTKSDAMKEKQAIRNHNIGQRILGGSAGANLSKKRLQDKTGQEIQQNGDEMSGKTKKRARLGPHSGKNRAGFEGKKADFINNKD